VLIISFTSPNPVLLIHHEFEGGVRYVLVFLFLYFFMGFFVYFPLHIHIYIQVSGPQIIQVLFITIAKLQN
jgi:hypothetical protein